MGRGEAAGTSESRDHQFLQLQDIDRALLPVVLPADNEVAPARLRSVRTEPAGPELEFDSYGCPQIPSWIHKPLGVAIREPRSKPFNDEAEFFCQDTEKKYAAGLVRRSITHPANLQRRAI